MTDTYRQQVVRDGVRLHLTGEDLDTYVVREKRLAELEVLAEYHGDWTDDEAGEYFELSALQERLGP